jgi:DNA-binding MarR family transcriptional regulator
VTNKTFTEQLGMLYARAGRPPLEGRFVALLLLTVDEISVGDAAQLLGVTKNALLKTAVPMLERGDVKRSRDPRTRQHLYSLSDHAYTRDLRDHANLSRAVTVTTQQFLSARSKVHPEAARRLRNHALVSGRAADALERILQPEERAQEADIEKHLEQDWDALPPRKGRGRHPKVRS